MKRFAAACLPVAVLVLAASVAAGCADTGSQPAERPVPANRADSVALRIYDASGGGAAWASVPYLRFDFATGNDTARTVRARHLWNRRTGDYRVEMEAGGDTVYVALFNVNDREGTVYLNGEPVDSSRNAGLLEQAYRRFINDTYWLLAPLKVFDPGVRRSYAADSSGPGAEVVSLAFEEVGLTPGDRYWFYANPETGRMERWDFRLQHFGETTPTASYTWDGYEAFEAPGGTVHLSARKHNPYSTIYTDNLDLPSDVPSDLFTDPAPRL